jgi:transposase-like protein
LDKEEAVKPSDERKRRVAGLLTLGGLSTAKAAEAVGVKPETVRKWLSRDPEFRRLVETWKKGPPPDPVAIAQSRRVIIDELAHRVLYERSKLTLRELLAIHARLTDGTPRQTEEKSDDETTDGVGAVELTSEQAERLWADIASGARRIEEVPAEDKKRS